MNRRLPLIPTLIVAAAVAAMIGLGVWQLQRAGWKERLLAQYAAAEALPPVSWPSGPVAADRLPLFRYATGVCLRPIGKRAIAGENKAGEPGYVHIVQCATAAEGPPMSVQVGWSKNPNTRVDWAGGPVSGIIIPDRVSGIRLVAASAPPGLQPSAVPSAASASAITPGGHRLYAATWFALAAAALIIYMIGIMKRGRTE